MLAIATHVFLWLMVFLYSNPSPSPPFPHSVQCITQTSHIDYTALLFSCLLVLWCLAVFDSFQAQRDAAVIDWSIDWLTSITCSKAFRKRPNMLFLGTVGLCVPTWELPRTILHEHLMCIVCIHLACHQAYTLYLTLYVLCKARFCVWNVLYIQGPPFQNVLNCHCNAHC